MDIGARFIVTAIKFLLFSGQYDILFKHNSKYQVEVSVEGVYGVDNETPLRFDFGIYGENGIVAFIECQGEQHYKPVEKFGGERAFVIQQRNDEEKRKYAREKNMSPLSVDIVSNHTAVFSDTELHMYEFP